ncbi:MAG: hypothetical protein FWE19_09785, partial [Oscillospiraceae bacterium]|nr:hypothetical protein [Oscillospiraceae bacterium]
IEAETSVGPFYTVTWRIEDYPPENTTIAINTDEDSAILFDLATATFTWEDVLPIHYETLPEASPVPIYQTQNSPTTTYEISYEIPHAPASQAQNPPFLILVGIGAVVAFIATGVYLLIKRRKGE